MKEWVKQCDERGFKITGKEACTAVADYRQECGEPVEVVGMQGSQVRQSFTNENFVKAIVRFVVSDDQVRSLIQDE